MSSQKVFVRKQGKVLTVFVDPATNQPIPISSVDDNPVGGFPQLMGLGSIQASWPGAEIIMVEGDQKEGPPAGSVFNVQDASTGQPLKNPKAASARPASAPVKSASVGGASITLTGVLKAFSELARSDAPKEELEAVGSFLLNLAPSIEAELKEAVRSPQQLPRKRFKL